MRQGDAGRFQVRHIHSKDGAGADTKVGIDIKRCNLKASVEGLSARRSGAEVIASSQEGEFIRGDFIDGGIPSIWKITININFQILSSPAVMLDNLKVTQASSIESLKLVHKTSEVIGRSLLDLDLVRIIFLVLDDLGYVDLSDKPIIALSGKLEGAFRIFLHKVVNQFLAIF